MWIIIVIIGSLCVMFFIFVHIFGDWKMSLIRLADSYIYGIENEHLSAKDSFLKALTLRYRLKKSSELIESLEKRRLDENQIMRQVRKLLLYNSLRKNMEYRYESILVAKDFVEEAVDLGMSRSMAEGWMQAGERVKNDMLWEPYHKDIRNKNYGLLDLLVCGMAIERCHIVKNKSYNEVAQIIKDRFKGWNYFEKYLGEAQNI